jgi:hypothetical protein
MALLLYTAPGRGGFELRRTVLITLNSVFTICAGLWMGAILGVGAVAAPAAFQALEGMDRGGTPVAASVVAASLRRLDAVSVVLLSVMLAVGVFETFYRKRNHTARMLALRALLVVISMLITVYLARMLTPEMLRQQAQPHTELFQQLHAQYRGLAWIQILIGAVTVVMTMAANIGPRRDGGHPRD